VLLNSKVCRAASRTPCTEGWFQWLWVGVDVNTYQSWRIVYMSWWHTLLATTWFKRFFKQEAVSRGSRWTLLFYYLGWSKADRCVYGQLQVYKFHKVLNHGHDIWCYEHRVVKNFTYNATQIAIINFFNTSYHWIETLFS